VFISNFEQFLTSRRRVGYVQLDKSIKYTYIYSPTSYFQYAVTISHVLTDEYRLHPHTSHKIQLSKNKGPIKINFINIIPK
jgi:hypothetical protein